jgi:hypothetical protein
VISEAKEFYFVYSDVTELQNEIVSTGETKDKQGIAERQRTPIYSARKTFSSSAIKLRPVFLW